MGSTNFDSMKGGIKIGESHVEPGTDNVRSHWNNFENTSPTKQSNIKPPSGYAVF